MGQNQDKLEGGEQALCEGTEETGPCPDSGDGGNPKSDVMEGGSSCEEEEEEEEEEAGNTEEKPGAQDLGPSQEPTTPSTEKPINLRVSPFTAKEVRQGGAVGKEGGGRGERGRTAPLVPLETGKNQKSRARSEERAKTFKVFDQIKKEQEKTEEELRTSSKVKMENQIEDMVQHEEESFSGDSHEKHGLALTSVDAYSFDTKEHSKMMKSSIGGAYGGANDLIQRAETEMLPSLHQHQNDTMTVEVEDEDLKLCAGTVGHLSERKEPPSAKPQHPLKNMLQKEPLLDMSDTIHHRPPKERTENTTKGETLTFDEGSIYVGEEKAVVNDYSFRKPKVTEAGQQKEPVRPYLHMKTSESNQTTASFSEPSPVVSIEPSSILEKLLKRNKTEATPSLSKIKEVDIYNKDSMDDLVESNVKVFDNAAAEISTDKTDQLLCNKSHSSNQEDKPSKAKHATKDHDSKELDVKQINTADYKTSNVLRCQPEVIGNILESSLAKLHQDSVDYQCANQDISSRDALVKEGIMLNIDPATNLSSNSLQSSALLEKTSCEMNVVNNEEAAPSSVSTTKGHPAGSSQLLNDEEIHTNAVGANLQIMKENKGEAESTDVQSVSRKAVKTSTENTAAPAVDAGSVSVISEETCQVAADMRSDKKLRKAFSTENVPDHVGKEKDDSVTLRDKSQNSPRTRPVSELIKETIQLHEKLQHPDRSKPPEIKTDEQGQSVKVAQMKAAFDSAQKSPEKPVERKPSVRKGRPIPVV
ncbi:DNA ligase 1 [Sphaeramia orbicularis]|uniref:DNA ligase 1 n=1 Tax=Sphaeramia orbicularis TaxID=375764 RepID=UPI0011809E02|nr:DNA ligase 1-like [Sphaeramia orbicularis]